MEMAEAGEVGMVGVEHFQGCVGVVDEVRAASVLTVGQALHISIYQEHLCFQVTED